MSEMMNKVVTMTKRVLTGFLEPSITQVNVLNALALGAGHVHGQRRFTCVKCTTQPVTQQQRISLCRS